jgi:hypothetical protein
MRWVTLLLLLSGCVTTRMSAGCREQISNCLARCDAVDRSPRREGMFSSGRDQRSACERECHNTPCR